MYLIILISAWPKLPISLQASSGAACRSLAALISLPRFSASSRSGRNPFMQSSEGPACVGGAAMGVFVNGVAPAAGNEPGEGAAPKEGVGAAPFTGGNAGSLATPALPGNGAGN